MDSTENQNAGGVDQISSGDTGESKNQVSYQTYQKSVDQEKNLRKRLAEEQAQREALARRLEEIEIAEASKKGNVEEVITKLKEQNKQLENSLSGTKDSFIITQKKNALKTEAIKRGCKNPEKFLKLLDSTDLQLVQINENFEVNMEDVNSILEKSVKEDDIGLFSPTNIKVADRTPANQKTPESLKELSRDKLNQAMSKMNREEFNKFIQNLDKLY